MGEDGIVASAVFAADISAFRITTERRLLFSCYFVEEIFMMTNSTAKVKTRRRIFSTNYLAKVAILGAIAWGIMLLEFVLPIFPGFLKFDFSDIIALIGSLALGPVAGILIELIKNLLHLFVTLTSGVGELANFIVGSAFVGVAGLYYSAHKTKKGAIACLLLGVVSIVVTGALVNYFITIPLYSIILVPFDVIINMASEVIPAIHDKPTLVLYAFCPFNLLKGIVLILITLPIYKRLSPILHRGL
jgi:riboflavin transporter FmnP